MKIQIRQGVFETNSSSMHSLTVMKRDDTYTSEEIMEDIYLYEDDIDGKHIYEWCIDGGSLEFGRSPFRVLSSFVDKWLYACASLVVDYKDDVYNQLENLAFKYIRKLNKITLPTVVEHIPDKDDKRFCNNDFYKKYGKTEDELIEYLDAQEKIWDMEIEYWKTSKGYWCFDKPYTGRVDLDILSGFLEAENITLEDFLINKKYVVIQDGDEYCYWDDMKKSGLVNMDVIDHEYPEEEDFDEETD